MKVRTIGALLAVVFAGVSMGQEAAPERPTEARRDRVEGALEPPKWVRGESEDYRRRVEKLLAFEADDPVMLVRPSFTSEWLVQVVQANQRDVADRRAEPRYEISFATTNANVWYAASGEWSDEASEPASSRERRAAFEKRIEEWIAGGRKPPAPTEEAGPSLLEHIRVTRCSAPCPTPLAKRITAAWRRMLLAARYSDKWNAGFDGTRFVFGCSFMLGETWSPDAGTTAALMVEVGLAMRAYVCSEESERAAALRTVEARLGELEQRLQSAR